MRDPGLRQDRRTELQVGLLVAVAALLLVAGIFWISGAELGRGFTLHGVAPGAAQLTDGASVYLSGVQVGSVQEVRLREDFRVDVRMRLDSERRLPADTRGVIRSGGFIGAQVVEIRPGTAEAPLAEGDTIPLDTGVALQDLADQLSQEATAVMERVREVLSERLVSSVEEASTSMAAAMQEIEGLVETQRGTTERLLGNLERSSEELAELTARPELGRTVARMDTLSDRLARASVGLDTTMANLAVITRRLEAGEGTFGRALTDEGLYDQLSATLENLQRASEEVGLLAQDLRERPQTYLRELDFSVF